MSAEVVLVRGKCAYEGRESEIIPACQGKLAWIVRGYWQGEARKKHGPDMLLCERHGPWLKNVNPMQPVTKL